MEIMADMAVGDMCADKVHQFLNHHLGQCYASSESDGIKVLDQLLDKYFRKGLSAMVNRTSIHF